MNSRLPIRERMSENDRCLPSSLPRIVIVSVIVVAVIALALVCIAIKTERSGLRNPPIDIYDTRAYRECFDTDG